MSRLAKKVNTIVKSTKCGKLFIEPADLFAKREVQILIDKVSKSRALSDVAKLTINLG